MIYTNLAIIFILIAQLYLTAGFYYLVTQKDDKLSNRHYIVHSFKLFFFWPWVKNK